MEKRHVKIEYSEAINSKKGLLSAEINIINSLRNLKEYLRLRKKEQALKNKLRTEMSSLKKKLEDIQDDFEKPKFKQLKNHKSKKEKQEDKTYNPRDLEEIRRKLASLE